MSSRADSFDRLSGPMPVWGFLVRALLWSVALFGLVRLAWVDRHVIGALIELQTSVIFWYGAPRHAGIQVDSSCSGADVMALCAGVLLAYPIAWSRRLAGAALGLGLLLALNAVRIASLHAVASDPFTLRLLHVYIWPAILTAATVAFVFVWTRSSERRTAETVRRWRRFGVVAAGAFVIYAFAAPWALSSAVLHEVGVWTAAAGSAVLTALGAQAWVSGNVLVTSRGVFQVTQECLFTPVLPLYFATVAAVPISRRARAAAMAAGIPLFLALGVARLLVLALPPAIAATPVVLAHGFYQLMTGAAVIVAAAHIALRRGTGLRASARTAAALGVALASGIAAAHLWVPALAAAVAGVRAIAPWSPTSLAPPGDAQGALQLLPPFQIALAAGLWCALTGGGRWRGLAAAVAALAGFQVALLVALGAVAAAGIEPHTLLIRAAGLVPPLGIALVAWTRNHEAAAFGDASYRRFWQDVGERFPDLGGAPSTVYYFENEQRLISGALRTLDGMSLLKTDLWDEAKNTRIMQWAADQGARVYGIDLSEPIVRQARREFGHRPLKPVVTDVRRLPFGDSSFDAVYSMGTIEHFAETEATVAEFARVLRPGGRLILGVPNRFDPFLRPLMVAVMYRLGLYGYGCEKSYSRRALRRMIEDAGLMVRQETGMLFLPGWLRMLDLWCHTRARPLSVLTGALIRPFVWIDRWVPEARRHGYLLATVGEKPASRLDATAGDAGTGAGPVWPDGGGEVAPAAAVHTGTEVVVDARGCAAGPLRSLPRLQALFDAICADLDLRPLSPAIWHVFPGHGGITGLLLLSESHLTIHTYPELGAAAINLYCCRHTPIDWPWDRRLEEQLGARHVEIRRLRRG